MMSNTGWTSVGDSLITFSMSVVAVCRSSASLVSLNSRTFSIAITAWPAKVFSKSISPLRKASRLGSGQATTIAPDGSAHPGTSAHRDSAESANVSEAQA